MIYLIITTSLTDKINKKSRENREQTYINGITNTLKLLPNNIKPIIVENNGSRKTILDNFGIDVIYTNNNTFKGIHKGVNELMDIKEVINKYNIDDNDIIIKITGRYYPLNNTFFNLINNEYDVFIKFFNVSTEKFMDNDCVLGLYAIKCHYLKTFNYNNSKLSPEVEFSTFINMNINKDKINSIKTLYLRCYFANTLKLLDV